MTDKRYFEIYRLSPDGKKIMPFVTVISGIDEKDAWVNFAENGFYKDYPEDTTFVANEVDLYKSLGIGLTKEDQADIAKDRQAMLDCLKNGDYTDITNDPL